jgi:phage-related protein
MPQTEILVFREAPGGDTPLLIWLETLKKTERKAYVKCLAFIETLGREGYTLQRPTAAPLRNGIHELRPTRRSVNYRILYFFCGKSIACLSHGITKESEVPPDEIDLAISRKELVAKNKDRYTRDWEVPA